MTSRELRGERVVLRRARDDDTDMLVAWHDDPGVARYWDEERFSADQIRARLQRADVESYIVEADGEPVGYLQVWQEGRDEGGIDMFLVPGARGRGLGSDAGATVARHLRDARGWSRVTVDPYVWNEPAIRAWRRAGFRAVGEREADEEHAAPWLLMEFVD